MTGQRIFRFEVPVDDEWHVITSRHPLHVFCRDATTVEYWAWSGPDDIGDARTYKVIGTGQVIPDNVAYVGTAVAPGGALVWHLVRRLP